MAGILGASAVTATMAQGAQTPWRDDHEAELYAQDPREFLLDRCQMWMDNIHWFGNYVIAATYYLPAFEMLPGGKKFFRSQTSQDEALWQGKVGLVLGKGPLAFRLHLAPEFDGGPVAGFDLTEAGTQKRLAVYLVRDPAEVPGVDRLGPDALDPSLDVERLGDMLRAHSGQLKGVLTTQSVIAGIGNAYSDEILHAARLSPFKNGSRLTDAELASLHSAMRTVLTDAVERSVGQKAATLKGEKRSGLQVHARTGLPCPVCGDTVREVSFADKSFQYCPTCQTEGRNLADRRLSKLLK